MPRYIDADALTKRLAYLWNVNDDSDFANKEVWHAVEEAPTVDVPDRKVGKWVWMGDKGDSRWMCSVCKSKEDVPTIMGKPIVWDYCPNCGARMKGESDEHTGTD